MNIVAAFFRSRFSGTKDESIDFPVDKMPCKNKNSNVCVAEGCYGYACIRLLTDKDDSRRIVGIKGVIE